MMVMEEEVVVVVVVGIRTYDYFYAYLYGSPTCTWYPCLLQDLHVAGRPSISFSFAQFAWPTRTH